MADLLFQIPSRLVISWVCFRRRSSKSTLAWLRWFAMAVAAVVVAAMVDTVAGVATAAAVAATGVSASEICLVDLALTVPRRCQRYAHGPLPLVNR